jgi:hypothetical protein
VCLKTAKNKKASPKSEARGASGGGAGGGEAAAQPVEGDEEQQQQKQQQGPSKSQKTLTYPTTATSTAAAASKTPREEPPPSSESPLVELLRCVGGSLLDPTRFGLNVVVGLYKLNAVDPDLESACCFNPFYT